MKNNTIDATLLNARVALENAQQDSNVAAALTAFGYGPEKITEGVALLDTAEELHQQQKKEYGEQYAATDALDLALNTANKNYMRYVKLSRVVLKDDRGAWEALQLSGRRLKTYSGWIKQAKIFYTNAMANAASLNKLEDINIGVPQLQAGLQEVTQVEQLLSTQLREMGEAQSATLNRDKAMETLMDYMSDFTSIARIALENDPQYLEALGIVEPS
ncbi:MAG: hypothetical protein JXQ90_03745 [Cyclobacteriaceae bacterium]